MDWRLDDGRGIGVVAIDFLLSSLFAHGLTRIFLLSPVPGFSFNGYVYVHEWMACVGYERIAEPCLTVPFSRSMKFRSMNTRTQPQHLVLVGSDCRDCSSLYCVLSPDAQPTLQQSTEGFPSTHHFETFLDSSWDQTRVLKQFDSLAATTNHMKFKDEMAR